VRSFLLVDKVGKLPERTKKSKSKAIKNAANEAYQSTLTERHFLTTQLFGFFDGLKRPHNYWEIVSAFQLNVLVLKYWKIFIRIEAADESSI